MKHKLTQKLRHRAWVVRGVKPSLSQWVPVVSRPGEHIPKPRPGDLTKVLGGVCGYPEHTPDPDKLYEVARPGAGRNILRKKMNLMDPRDYIQPIFDESGVPVGEPKWTPVTNALGNTNDVGPVEGNIVLNERVSAAHWMSEFYENNES